MKSAFILLTFLCAELPAQTISVQLQPPPPFQFRVEDMWNLVVINPGSVRQVFLRGTAVEVSTGLIVDVSTSVFDLPPGTKRIRSNDVGSVTINQKKDEFESVINRLSSLPNGSYEICIEVIEAVSNSLLGSSCIDHDVLSISQVTLLYPEHKTTLNSYNGFNDESGDTLLNTLKPVQSKINSQIVFTWLPPVPVPLSKVVRYKIKMVEVFGMQSAYDAMNSNPLFFSSEGILTTSYLFPLAARDFNPDRTYAWQVEAYIDGHLQSQSEIFEFSFPRNTTKKNSNDLHKSLTGQLNELNNGIEGLPGGLSYKNNLVNKNHLSSFTGYQSSSFSGASFNNSNSSPINFLFEGEIFSEVSNRSAKGSDRKPSFSYASFAPSVNLYGIPFTLNALLSSENSSDRQNINSLSFQYDLNAAKEIVQTTAEAEGENNVPGLMNFLTDFHTLGVGTNYPSYTPLTLQGVPVTGISFEYNPAWFYIASAFQKNQKAIDNAAFRRDLYSGRIGFGKLNSSHIFFTGVYTKDNAASISVDSSNQMLTPNSNYVFGIDGKLNLFDDKLTLESEIAAAMLTRDNRDADLINEDIPDLARRIFQPKISSQIDYAYSLKTSFDNKESGTKVTAGVKMIGPGYRTLGNPTLRNDRFEIDSKIDQRFIDRQVSVSLFLKYFHDNLINNKLVRTSNVSPGVVIGLRFKKYPYLNFSYTPSFMNNDASDPLKKLEFKNQLFTTATGYNFRLGTVMVSSNLFYMFNEATSLDTLSSYTSNSFTLAETFVFQFPLIVTTTFGMSFSDYAADYSKITSFDGSISYTFFEHWTNTIGSAYSVESKKNDKLNFYFMTGYTISENFTLELRTEINNYKDKISRRNNYDEFVMRSTAKFRF